MWQWIKAHKNAFLNVFTIAAPVATAVVTGGVFTPVVLIAAVAGLAGKLAASPLDHSTTAEAAIAAIAQANNLAKAVEAAKKAP